MDEKIQNKNLFTMNFISENENFPTEFETQINSSDSIKNSEKNLIFLNSNENYKIDDDLYKIKKKKPGRIKKTTIKKNPHSRKENGNIRSKIKNKFFNFIIKFFNEKIKIHTKLKVKFRKIDYKLINIRNKKSKLNLDFFLNKKIKNFLNYKISEIYKKPKDQNQKTLKKIEKFDSIKKFLNIPIKTFYKEIFLKQTNSNQNSNVVYYKDFINKIQKNIDNNFFKSSDDDNFYLELLNKYSNEEFLKFYNNLFVVKK
jgi:hypothetical protein